MGDRSFEQVSKKVAELALAGQGCSVWDVLAPFGSKEIESILDGAQITSPNINKDQVRKPPGVLLEDDSLATFGKLDFTLTLIDTQSKRLLDVFATPFTKRHIRCANFLQSGDTDQK